MEGVEMKFPMYPGIAFNKLDKNRCEIDTNNKGQMVFRIQKKDMEHAPGFQTGKNRILHRARIVMDDNGWEYDSNIPSEMWVNFSISQKHMGDELPHSLGGSELQASNHEARQEAMYADF